MVMKVRFLSEEEAERQPWVVCLRWSDPPVLPDNLRGPCFLCGVPVQFRPAAPKNPKRICLRCAEQIARAN
jgi:hypothetical protein